MTNDEIQQLIEQDPALATPLREAARALPSRTMTFGSPTEWLTVISLLPITVFIVGSIGLPWLYEAKRYSELWRLKFHDWLDTQYELEGFNPDDAEAFGDALRKKLEQINEPAVRAAWEQLSKVLKEGKDGD